MSTPDETVIREYARQAEADPMADTATIYARIAEHLKLSVDHVEGVIVEWWFGAGAG